MRDLVRAGGPIANRPASSSDLESIPVRCRLRTGAHVVVRLPRRKVPWLCRLVERPDLHVYTTSGKNEAAALVAALEAAP